MESGDRTKYKFADSIKELMQKVPIDKITVKDIRFIVIFRISMRW